MGRKLVYKPGSWYRVDDRTGFPERAENTRKQWNNIYTREKSFELRNAQDFVRGRKDPQVVPDPRPLAAPTFLPGTSSLLNAVAIGATTLILNQSIALANGNVLAIMLGDPTKDSNNVVFFATVTGIGGDFNPDFSVDFTTGLTITIAQPFPGAAAAGNMVTNTATIAVQANTFRKSSG